MRARVCLFTDSLEPSGVGEHMLALAGALRPAYELTFVCPPSPTGRRVLERAAARGLATIARTVRQDRDAWVWLRDWLSAERIDLFHGHAGIGWEGHDGIWAAHAAGVPAIVRTEHLPNVVTDPEQIAGNTRLQAVIHRLICVSDEAGASFRRAGVPAEKLRVVRNGIDPLPAGRDRAGGRAGLGLPGGARLLLSVGRLVEQKGYAVLLEAAAAVLPDAPELHLLIAGEGPLEAALRSQAAALDLAGRVHFLGRREDVPALMAAADLFVLPSLFEGLPLVVLEAMAAGLPVVGTRVCGTAEAVVDGVTGRLVEAGDPAALAAALRAVLGDPALAARWGAAGRRRLQAEFSTERMARETRALYDELLAAAGRPTSAPPLPLGRAPRSEWTAAGGG